jgi:D-sedoheptulose 7-phosphate isomerase
MYQDLIRNELNEAAETLANFLQDEANIHAIQRAAVLLADSFKAGGKVLSCGNGGSHCDAMHFAEELTGRYRENRPGYPAIAISDVSHLSCVSNDFGYEYVSPATLNPSAVRAMCCWASPLPVTPAT